MKMTELTLSLEDRLEIAAMAVSMEAYPNGRETERGSSYIDQAKSVIRDVVNSEVQAAESRARADASTFKQGLLKAQFDSGVAVGRADADARFEAANQVSDFVKETLNGKTPASEYAKGVMQHSIDTKRRYYGADGNGKQ